MLENNSFFSRFRLITVITSTAILSWFAIHVLAVFGIFIAIGFPIWWMFSPKSTFCILCRAKPHGTQCYFCNKKIDKTKPPIPVSIRSALSNGMLVLVFTIISVCLVYGESKLLSYMGFPATPKTVSFVIPPKGQYRLGEVFPMKIEISGVKTPVNAIQADVGFNTSKLEVIDVNLNNSFANIFIQKEINNEAGYARITGGLPNPGFSESTGEFATVFFKGKSPGIVQIEFLPSSMVLANDGKGSNVLKDFSTVSYLILPERISPEEEELQRSVTLQSSVLGESTENDKMIFFEEGQVLGSEVGTPAEQPSFPNPITLLFTVIEKVDHFILQLYGKVLAVFGR